MGLRLGGGARRYVTFYPQDTGDKSRHQWICLAVAASISKSKWTTGHFYLLALKLARRADGGFKDDCSRGAAAERKCARMREREGRKEKKEKKARTG